MSHIISVYSTKAYKAYLLPHINNSDYSIIVNKDIFCLDKDIELQMEVIDNEWHFLPSEDYKILSIATGMDYTNVNLIDEDIVSVVFPNGTNLSVMFDVSNSSFGVFEKYLLDGMSGITIGKDESNDIVYNNKNLISREHAIIRLVNNQWIIEDRSANGIFVNARRVIGSRQLIFGDTISIFGLVLTYLGNILAVNIHADGCLINEEKFKIYPPEELDSSLERSKYNKAKPVFHRSPRQLYKIDDDVIDIEAPPQPKTTSKKPLGMIIGPSMTMALPMLLGCGLAIYSTKSTGGNSSAFMYTGLITAVSSAVIGTVWSLTNLAFDKKNTREEELHRFEAYSEYLIKIANTIKEKYEKNIASLKAMYVPAAECCNNDSGSITLWNRNTGHPDFLEHRLGLGDIPFQVTINVPKDRFTLINDSLSEKPAMIKSSYSTLNSVPICVDLLAHRMVGIVSTEGKKRAADIMHNLVAQIAASNCYTDVKMAFIFDEGEEDMADWEYLKWLPHVWSEDKRCRYYAENPAQSSDVIYELTKVFRNRNDGRGSYSTSGKAKVVTPQYIIFVSNPKILEGELITKYLYDENNVDVTTVFLCDGFENLPNTCTYIIQNDSKFTGMYSTDADESERQAIVFDQVNNSQLEKLSRVLADIEVSELETGGDIPSALTFFDMYGVHQLDELNVLDKWRKNRSYDSMKALIGQRAGGTPWYLDIHEKYHGPHGLIAGTTGSGKSETLQTYILSLALQFSPDDVGFFIIDYKGGGMANLFEGLPHMIGSISNLSGNQVKRAMVSIKSENKRRQRIFNEHGVNNINLYTRLYKNNEATDPIPHMFIIIDEFAELKREEPEFMRELISVAQVGRSLGVHLILATQKPSGTVDDNIWSNSKFRLCLRVQDRQDSNDMLHRPDAAYITQAGRCYMQVGNDELFELFQSGYSGATYDEELGSTKLDIAKMISSTGKAALVGNRLKLKQKENAKRRWIRTLTKAIVDCNYQYGDDIAGLFEYFESHGIDYAYSEYNAQRIRDLCKVIKLVEQTNGDITSDEGIDAIIATASATSAISSGSIKLPERKEKTQLTAVVEYLAKIAGENGYVRDIQLWMPVLPERICMNELNNYDIGGFFSGTEWVRKSTEWNIIVPIGKYDDPVNQDQNTVFVNMSDNGHHAIIGSVVSGKSTFLQTFMYGLVNRYTPDEINIYALDYSAKMATAFENMPHVGGVILENDDDKLAKFINMLKATLEQRKEIFKGGNYAQYVRNHGASVPAIILCIDNYSNFRSKTNGCYDDFFVQLSKDGVSYGIFMIVTAGGFNTNEIPLRMGENFKTVMCLELSDKFQYGDALHTMKIDTLPEVNIKGRGLTYVGESLLEFQTALCMDEFDDFKRMEKIEALSSVMCNAWKGKAAKPIPVIPDKPTWSEFRKLEEYASMAADDRNIPVAYDDSNASVYGIDLSKTYCHLTAGKSKSGKTNMIKAILSAALEKKAKVAVIDYDGDLRTVTQPAGIEVIDTDRKLFDYLLDLKPDFVARNKVKKEAEKNGLTGEEIYNIVNSQFEKRIIIIANLTDFVTHVCSPADTEPMRGAVENFLDKGALHNVFWFAGLSYEDVGKIVGNRVYELFIRDKNGIHFGGNVANQRIFNFDYIPYTEQTKSLKAGIGLLPSVDDEMATRKIIVPLVK